MYATVVLEQPSAPWQLQQNAEKPEFGLAPTTCTSGQKGMKDSELKDHVYYGLGT